MRSATSSGSGSQTIRFATFLAPNLFRLYEFIAHHVGGKLQCPTEVFVGTSYDQVAHSDVAFICSVPYVKLTRRYGPLFEPLAAPVLSGTRYQGNAVSYSDVIVHRRSSIRSFDDLRGRTWAYNEPHSQSGYGITCYHLVERGETAGYFGKVVKAGWHEKSIQLVARGEADGSAIDAHVLTAAQRDRPELVRRLRVVATLGPSTVQPVVASSRLTRTLREEIRSVLVEMADDARARKALAEGFVERFVSVAHESYDDVRTMLAVVEDSGFLTLH
jgi:ABC-type phosphate/phosphonate transport system substrate-binding protein